MTQRTWTARAILHIDMDAFFASVEQLDHPEWRGKPVIVGGSPTGRGVVSTASYEARRFGIHSAMPAAQAARRCPNAIWAPPRFSRYSELADAVCAIFSEFTPRVERVSIDEAYIDVTPTQHNPADPVSIGAMVGPEAFMEVRYLAHAKQQQALELIPAWADEFRRVFGRPSGGLVHEYRTSDAEVIVVALGSVLGTIKDTVDMMRDEGLSIGVLGITCFRPWPAAAVRNSLQQAKRVVVLEKSLAVGMGGIVGNNVSASFSGSPDRVHTVIAGLGGRSITRGSLRRVFEQALTDSLEPLTFLDLDRALVDRVLERERVQRRSGPIAEGILKDLGVVAAKIG